MATKKTETRGGSRPGSGSKPVNGVAMVVNAMRMTPKQWDAFKRWGGVDKLRKTMDYVLRAEAGNKTKAAKA
jgi:hypothetical protein